jgi:hypothetical protein
MSSFQGWRSSVFTLFVLIFSVGLLAHSTQLAAKPAWKNTGEYSGPGNGRRKRDRQETVIEEPVAQDPVIQEPIVSDPVILEPVPQPLPVNQAPFIGGSPDGSVYEYGFYDFLPSATDPEGDTLIFSVANKPSWADFDPTTGALYGYPDSGDVGRYSSIEIYVTDGHDNVALPVFAIDVLSAPLQSVTLNWQPPTENTDSSPLRTLAGYKIYYEDDTGQFVELIELSNPGLTSYVLSDLAAGQWRFSMTAYNLDGLESVFSNAMESDLSFP